ncbi:M50 family metallopeptidase [Nonomuraea muscovyensis]|uniref:M50 family metallopeptidase n=1 Tax=Nonomuraea muscovyensis TaxID=1124761 RepID=UPI0033EC6E1D
MTTDAGDLLRARPAVRPDLTIGPAMIDGNRIRHHLRIGDRERLLGVGAKEWFVIARLDGSTTLAEIGAAYAAEYGRRMDEAGWRQVLRVLADNGLLAGVPEPPAGPDAPRPSRWRTLMSYRFPVTDPDRLLERLAAATPWLFARAVVLPLAVLVTASLAGVLVALPELSEALRAGWRDGPVIAAAIPLVWASVVIHEVAHGLTCKHFGGRAPEIGVMWRFPILAPYCRTEGLQFFTRPAHRVYTAFAGIFAGLVVILPFWPVWLLAEPGGRASRLAAVMLVGGTLVAVFNLVPFFRLDGYFMLTYALNIADLRSASWEYLRQRRRAWRGGGAEPYPRGLALVYGTYGVASLLFGSAVAVVTLWSWYALLRPLVGDVAAVLVPAATAVLALSVALVAGRAQRRTGAGAARGRQT